MNLCLRDNGSLITNHLSEGRQQAVGATGNTHTQTEELVLMFPERPSGRKNTSVLSWLKVPFLRSIKHQRTFQRVSQGRYSTSNQLDVGDVKYQQMLLE